MNHTEITVDVICTLKNERKSVPKLIDDMMSQSLQPQRFILVDGDSDDGTYEFLEEKLQGRENFILLRDKKDLQNEIIKGPIARGRNIAIAHSQSEYILMMDAGCRYHKDWIISYVEAIGKGGDLFVGGSKLGQQSSIVDLAIAPILGFDLPSEGFTAKPTGTCRSLGISKILFSNLGGFNEYSKTGEDTDFINRALEQYTLKQVLNGAAIYCPNYNLFNSCERVIQYAKGDGSFNQSKSRYLRMILRMIGQFIFLISVAVGETFLSILLFSFELFFAYRFDFLKLFRISISAFLLRLPISIVTPYLYCLGYLKGIFNNRI